jgi:SagB-type dehydrogenase family enzyme
VPRTIPAIPPVRRARTIVCYWDHSQLVFSNYRTGKTVTATPITILLLELLNDWCALADLTRLLARFKPGNVSRAVRKLLEHGLLVQKNSPAAVRDDDFEKTWSAWLPHAGFFHFGTKDVHYESRPQELAKLERKLLRGSPQPPFYKTYSGTPKVSLRRPRSACKFADVLLRRRTERKFSRKDLPLESLSKLLFYTWGVTDFLEQPNFGRLPLKTSPSSGARHPVEAYLLGIRVEGLKPGLYHYAPRAHRLELLRYIKNVRVKGAQYCAGQNWVKGATALFIMTAVFPRAMWKYPTARAYRTVLLDAGHLCQTFCLVATWLNLAPFCTMALKDSLIEKDLEIDGVAESVIYIAGVGMPAVGCDCHESP